MPCLFQGVPLWNAGAVIRVLGLSPEAALPENLPDEGL